MLSESWLQLKNRHETASQFHKTKLAKPWKPPSCVPIPWERWSSSMYIFWGNTWPFKSSSHYMNSVYPSARNHMLQALLHLYLAQTSALSAISVILNIENAWFWHLLWLKWATLIQGAGFAQGHQKSDYDHLNSRFSFLYMKGRVTSESSLWVSVSSAVSVNWIWKCMIWHLPWVEKSTDSSMDYLTLPTRVYLHWTHESNRVSLEWESQMYSQNLSMWTQLVVSPSRENLSTNNEKDEKAELRSWLVQTSAWSADSVIPQLKMHDLALILSNDYNVTENAVSEIHALFLFAIF